MSKFWQSLQNHRLLFASFYLSACLFGIVSLTHSAYTMGDQTLAQLTNAERTSQGLAPLAWNSTLSQAAWMKAQDMCTQGYWAHTAPNGATGWTFMTQAGYNYTTAGENLARDFGGDAETVAAWMASPGHRANILKPAYKDIGIASSVCTMDGSQTKIVVALYGATGSATNPPVVQKPTPAPVVRSVAAPAPTSPTTVAKEKPAQKPELTVGMKLWQLFKSSLETPLFERLVAAPANEPRAVASLN